MLRLAHRSFHIQLTVFYESKYLAHDFVVHEYFKKDKDTNIGIELEKHLEFAS
jgi:hypothetical protein